MTPLLAALIVLATLRTWRLLVIDDIADPVRSVVYRSLERLAGPGSWSHTPRYPRRVKLAEALSEAFTCPWCLPFWLGLGWTGTALAWGTTWPWQLAAGSLGLSWIVGHVAMRLDPAPEE